MEQNHATHVLDELARHYVSGKMSRLAEKLELKPPTLSGWKDRNTLDYERIYSAFPEIEAHWLLTHTGPMLKGTDNCVEDATVTYSRPTPPAVNAEVEALKKVVALLEKDNARLEAELLALKSTSRAIGAGLVPELSGRKKQLAVV